MNDRQTAPIQYGPVQGEGTVSSGLDFYKPTMSQVAFEKHQEAEVTFTFKNRGKNKLTDYVDAPELQARLDTRRTGWTTHYLQ